MLQAPRIVALDDDQIHLESLTQTLNRHGVACLSIHISTISQEIRPCPNVRVIFADLHLLPGPDTEHFRQFGAIGELLTNTIKPQGPYLLVLWTAFPDQAVELQNFLEEKVDAVTKPFAICALDKSDHLDEEGQVSDPNALMKKIEEITDSMPELGVLFDWENRVLEATGDTVSSILEMIPSAELSTRLKQLRSTLSELGIAAVGTENVEVDRFRAVNEALLPILEDRIANLKIDASKIGLWDDAVSITNSQSLSPEVTARLNWMAHFATVDQSDRNERGVVLTLMRTVTENFEDVFGIGEIDASRDEFRCKDFEQANVRFRWVLVQVQAACDYAQRHAGSIPCYLGLELPSENRRSKTPPQSLWESPVFELDGLPRLLHVSARFPVSMSRSEFEEGEPVYRLREQVLYDLTYKLHSHGSRPGVLSFR